MKDTIIIAILMIAFVIFVKEMREPEKIDVIFTDKEIEEWEPFN
tara:strand:+ start:52 stop:183 length:132 start_codon:yes stop_codon:yes gene_type:complete